MQHRLIACASISVLHILHATPAVFSFVICRKTTLKNRWPDPCPPLWSQRRSSVLFSKDPVDNDEVLDGRDKDPDDSIIDAPSFSGNSNNTDNYSSADRAINIVSELKANAALFAAFAFGSLNLPSTLTFSESKVLSVTTSLSVTRPLPESTLLQAFVILDASTLCFMTACVAASQLLIYRLADGSYESNYDEDASSGRMSWLSSRTRRNGRSKQQQQLKKNSALGKLVTQYGGEFAVARITFDLGLITLLLAVAVRATAIFGMDISFPVAVIIGTTALTIGLANIKSYIEVFLPLEFLNQETNVNNLLRWILAASFPALLAVYLFAGEEFEVNDVVSKLQNYSTIAGEGKIRLVTQMVTDEKAEVKVKKLKKQVSFYKKKEKSVTAMTEKDKDKLHSDHEAKGTIAEKEKEKIVLEKQKEEGEQ